MNLNTLVLIVGLIGTCGSIFYTAGQQTKRIDEIEAWQDRHDELHKEAAASYAARLAAIDGRVEANASEARRIENLTYRTTVLEQNQAATQRSLSELKDQLNTLGGDIRVIREILERVGQAQIRK
ncbi:hypothetical protein [Mangrovicoccus algicola]|uniref:Uncharacterized protein n=1 Tax=Mangrovicoccus algicola TaxID=2771008 RepID=A0A8J7CJ96_9RHOB|nr:hypothetical protein [Mangrovicoccus algicola]MBE3637456.1 hypothetical protein [Mangrovicoccus algicola]